MFRPDSERRRVTQPPQHFKLSEIPFVDPAQLHPQRFLPSLAFFDGTWTTYLHLGEIPLN